MPHNFALFSKVDKSYRQSVRKLEKAKLMTYKQFFQQDDLKENAQGMVRQLETLMKSLTKYIEEKRERFPRLFFLSNEQIIQLCGVVEDIFTLEKSFHKMFEGIHRLVIVYREHQLSPA